MSNFVSVCDSGIQVGFQLLQILFHIIRPSSPIQAAMIERDESNLERIYQTGRADMKKDLEKTVPPGFHYNGYAVPPDPSEKPDIYVILLSEKAASSGLLFFGTSHLW